MQNGFLNPWDYGVDVPIFCIGSGNLMFYCSFWANYYKEVYGCMTILAFLLPVVMQGGWNIPSSDYDNLDPYIAAF